MTYLDYLGHAVGDLPGRKCGKESEVNEDVAWLPKCTNEVLAMWGIDSGLSTNRRVNHRKKGRRDLDKLDASHAIQAKNQRNSSRSKISNPQSSSDKSSKIANDTATECKDHSISGALVIKHPVLDFALDFSALRALSRSDFIDEEPCLVVGLRCSLFERGLEVIEIDCGEIRVGDKDIGGGRESGCDGFEDIGKEMESNVDGLIPQDGDFEDIGRGRRHVAFFVAWPVLFLR